MLPHRRHKKTALCAAQPGSKHSPLKEYKMTRDEIYSRLTSVFCDVFDDDTLITDAASADDIDDWDSLAQISLITAIENEFGICFDMKSALHMKSVEEIVNEIVCKGIK